MKTGALHGFSIRKNQLFEKVTKIQKSHRLCYRRYATPPSHTSYITGSSGSREQGWRSGDSARLAPMWPGFYSRTRRDMWVEFVVGSLLCSERSFSGNSDFPLSSKTNISKFQFDLGMRRHFWTSSYELLGARGETNYIFLLQRRPKNSTFLTDSLHKKTTIKASDTVEHPRSSQYLTHAHSCFRLVRPHHTYIFFSTGETRPIKSNLTCDTKNLIYMIQCDHSNLQYIGETRRRLKDRCNEHRLIP